MKTFMYMLVAVSLSIFICLMFVGCATKSQTNENPEETVVEKNIQNIKVGFSQMENNGPWRVAETNSIRNEAKKRNINLIYTDAQGSVDKQIQDVQYLIEQGVDYILLAPKKYEELGVALQMAKEANVKVVLVDRSCAGEVGEDYITLVISDNVWEAQQAGHLLVEATNGQANIVELTGTVGSSSAEERTRGFWQVISKYENMKIICSQSADFFRAEGKKVMENIIREYGERITAVYAHNDEMAIGAIMALKAAGMEPGEDVMVVSVDGEKDALKAIIADDLYATIECTPLFGPILFDVIERHLSGEEIQPLIINKDRIFTKENALLYIDEAY